MRARRQVALLVAASLAALPSAARAAAARPGFGPGEETVIQFRYLNVPTGEGRIVVGKAEGIIWPIIFQARTRGVAGLVDVREHLVSYWDSQARLPRGSDLQAVEMGDYHVERVRFDRAAGKQTISISRAGLLTTRTFDVPKDAQEISSAFLWLRLQRLLVGDRYEVPISSQDQRFALVAQVDGRETIDTPAGTFPCVRVKIRTGLSGNFSTRRDTTVWLSDDPRHVFVRVSAEFAVGSVVGTISEYRPGAAPPGAIAEDAAGR